LLENTDEFIKENTIKYTSHSFSGETKHTSETFGNENDNRIYKIEIIDSKFFINELSEEEMNNNNNSSNYYHFENLSQVKILNSTIEVSESLY